MVWFKDYRYYLDLQDRRFATGIEHQPGPQSVAATNSTHNNFILDVGNITCLGSHLQDVAATDAHAFVFQEHSCPTAERSRCYKYFSKSRRRLLLGPLDPEVKHNLGGVGISCMHSRPPIRVKPKTQAFQKATELGRCDHYAIDIGHSAALSIYNWYGWSGSHQNAKLAARTNAMVEATIDEYNTQPLGPAVFAGDINCNTQDLRALSDLLVGGGWVDLGERADIWNRPKGQPTCLAPNSSTPTRRDYVFANAEALQLIVDFEVRPQQHFPVHSFLRVTFRPPKGDRYFWHNFRPDNLTNSFDKFCAANPAENANSTDTEDKCGKDKRLEHLSTFHHRLDRGFSEARPALLDMLASQDTDSYWQTWNNVVEHAFCRAYNLQGKQERNSKGRGQTTIRKQKVTKPTLNVDGDVIDEDLCNSELTLLRRQLSRCKQWIARLKIPDGDSRLATYHALNAQASELISRDIHIDDSVALEISQSFPAILANPMDHPRHRIQLMRLCQHYEKCISAKQVELQSEKATKNRANDFEQDTHHAKAYRFLSAQTSPPITYLRRSVTGPCGEAPGTFATEPAEIDKILIDAWSNIYNGTKETFESLVENFCSRFQHLLYIRGEEQQDPIDPQRFMDSCMEANNSAGGMDGWDPIDFKLLNLTAFTYLTDLLNHIEQGGHWPTGLRHGRLVFLAKDASEVEEPLSYRPLLILPHLYRRWAAYRLHTLEPWVRKWANSGMFAGVPQQGAEDAW